VSPISPVDLPTGPLSLPPFQQPNAAHAPHKPIVVVHNNRAAWTSFIFGIIATVVAVIDELPTSTAVYGSVIGLFAIYWGIRAIIRRNAGFASNLWAPVLGIVLGSVGTIIMFATFVANR
jgi:hypothetical protein